MDKYIRNLRIIYFMTLLSPILIIVIYFIVLQKGTIMLNNNIDNIFKYMIPFFAMIFISIGFVVFNKKLKDIKIDEQIDSKLYQYKRNSVQRIALIEGVAVFSTVAFIITLNALYVIYTFLILLCYIFIYPTTDKISKDLKISSEDKIDPQIANKKPTNFFGKHPWIIIPFVVFMILINYNSFKEFFANKVVLPLVQADSGVIKDSIYKNEYLGWSINVPSGYSVIPISELEKNEKKGNEIYGDNSIDDKPIRLLNITKGDVSFQSTLNPRVLYPNLTSEDKYLETLDKQIQSTQIDSLKIEKSKQGTILIDKIEFKYVEYTMTHEMRQIKLLYFSKFDKDYMLDISISSLDTVEGRKMLDNLKNSKFRWE